MARPRRNQNEYLGPAIFSVCLHVGIVILALISWPSLSKPDPVKPHIKAVIVDEAMLEQMKQALPKPAVQEKPKPPEVDTRKQMEEARRKAEEAKKAEAARKAAAERKKQEAIALKKKQEADKKKKEEDKKLAEAKRLDEQKKAEEKRKTEQKRKEEEKRLAEEKKRQEELKKQEEEKRKALEQKLIAEREQARLEKAKQEELALQQQAMELEKMLQQQQQQQAAEKQHQQDVTELERYRALIYEAIKSKWIRLDGAKGLVAHIQLKLLPTGELQSATIAKSSGVQAFDQSALSAAYAVRKYPVPSDSRLFEKEFRNLTLIFKPQQEF
ncbi:protein TolA [Hahella sp. CCB-MM4]|uniref:cell envelope integrity protein TolA n=1 Tax=Hahella sp. (strain CCB-MM4) TaxID=1926491 RepID=UPI000B9B8542|nr:cell envelope integrity protein TolA [Hahella sp. CCB-MM4]OZG72112.1 protein TolA [Hahella sp. CCB-MM4]